MSQTAQLETCLQCVLIRDGYRSKITTGKSVIGILETTAPVNRCVIGME